MDRMTHERVNGIRAGYWSPEKKEELVQRLAAYENIGLEPEEISAKIEACNIYKSLGLTPDQIQNLFVKVQNLLCQTFLPGVLCQSRTGRKG